MTTDSGHWTPKWGDVTLTYDEHTSNGWKYGQSNAYTHFVCDYVATRPCQVSFEIVNKGTGADSGIFINNEALVNLKSSNNEIQIRNGNSYDVVSGSVIGKYLIKIYSNKFEVYRNNIKLGERDISDIAFSLELETGVQSGRWVQIKDIKIKEL